MARLRKRVELKDPKAMRDMALYYGDGDFGLPVDQAKCIELLRQSAGLGFPNAQFNLGNYYDDGEMGLEQNKEEASKCYKVAAEGGYLAARHNLVHGGRQLRCCCCNAPLEIVCIRGIQDVHGKSHCVL